MKRMGHAPIYILLFILLIPLHGCKKYEEGPLISFRSKDKRLNGIWRLEHLYINNIDSITAVSSQYCNGDLYIYYQSKQHNEGHWETVVDYQNCKKCYGYWGLSHNKKNIYIEHMISDSCTFRSVGPYLATDHDEWEIRKLTMDQLWLSTVYKGQNCWIHFKSIKKP
ncbi:MAG: hypothetical protein ABI772_14070 [Bacteroidota bacterium]